MSLLPNRSQDPTFLLFSISNKPPGQNENMRFTVVFSALTAIVAVKAATNTSESSAVDTIVQAIKQGNLVGAAVDLFTLGNCDIANDAGNYLYHPLPIATYPLFDL